MNNIKVCASFWIITLLFLGGFKNEIQSKTKVHTGLEELCKENFKILQGKRVGLITNPTGVNAQLESTIDILYQAPQVNLVALFGPEHGVRGNVAAGDRIENELDARTGLPMYSLFGKTRKPTPEMLKGIDVMVYDIQDIGCRSFTYISTMGLAMEACAENDIEFVVLDRPNPLGGNRIEGPLVEKKFTSFVSQYPIPYLYGLTCGELALLINEEHMIAKYCNLHIVKMKGWKRKMTFMDTHLPWIISSPHIPTEECAFYYPASGILGELGFVSIGVGYTLPFQLFGKDSIDAQQLANDLNNYHIPGVKFRPLYFKPFYAKGQGCAYQGVQLYIEDFHKAPLTCIQFYVGEALYHQNKKNHAFLNGDTTRFSMFDKVCGSDQIRLILTKEMKYDAIQSYWNKDVKAFMKLSQAYYLYK